MEYCHPPFSRAILPLLLLLLAAPALPAQEYKRAALSRYEAVVLRQNEFTRHRMRLPADFPLGEGALVAYLEGEQARAIIVQYAGKRSGDRQEFYYQEGVPFYIFSNSYGGEEGQHQLNRLYLDGARQILGWELNEVSQNLKSKEALLLTSNLLEDSRQLALLVQQDVDARKKALPAPTVSVVDALEAPENAPEIRRALAPDGTPLPAAVAVTGVTEPPPAPAAAVDSLPISASPEDAATALAAQAEEEAQAKAALQDEAPADPEVARWAAWANATREDRNEITPFPAELVLGKTDVPPLPKPKKAAAPDPAEQPEAKDEVTSPAPSSEPAPLPPPRDAPSAQ